MRFKVQSRCKKNIATFARCSAGLLVIFVLGGCESTPIHGEDKAVFQKAVRVNFNLDGGDTNASEPRSGRAIEIGYQGTKISSDQILASGQPPAYFNHIAFTSPNQLRNNFDFSYTDISWRWRHYEDSSLGTDILLGIGSPSLAMSVTSPTQSAYANFNTIGPQAGVGLFVRSSPHSSLHARATLFVSSLNGVQGIRKLELYYAYAPQNNLSLRFGYADWVAISDLFFTPEFRLHFSGPAFVLSWDLNVGK